jgi:hypothetical protein
MSKNIILVLVYHRHKLLDLIDSLLFWEPRCMPMYSHSLDAVELQVPVLSNPSQSQSYFMTGDLPLITLSWRQSP